jgi:hypothetical protein
MPVVIPENPTLGGLLRSGGWGLFLLRSGGPGRLISVRPPKFVFEFDRGPGGPPAEDPGTPTIPPEDPGTAPNESSSSSSSLNAVIVGVLRINYL